MYIIFHKRAKEFKKKYLFKRQHWKYINFTAPIEKEVSRIDKNVKEITKNISYILQFIYYATFMASS